MSAGLVWRVAVRMIATTVQKRTLEWTPQCSLLATLVVGDLDCGSLFRLLAEIVLGSKYRDGLTMPAASRKIEAMPSMIDMMKSGMTEIQKAIVPAITPTRPTRMVNQPARAAKTVVPGTEPYSCHIQA